MKDIKNANNENYYFLHPEHFCLLLQIKMDGNDTLLLCLPNTGVFKDTGYHQLCVAGLLCYARGVPTNQ